MRKAELSLGDIFFIVFCVFTFSFITIQVITKAIGQNCCCQQEEKL